jgi:NitT/TauT family transport system permease protein
MRLRISRRIRVLLARCGALGAVVVAWELLPRAGVLDAFTVVPFSEAVVRAVELLASGEVLGHLASTTLTILVSFLAAVLVGLPAGYLLWRHRLPYRLLNPYFTTYYALPIFVFYPALIAIFGLTVVPVIVIAAAWAVVAVIVNTVTGLDQMPPVYHKVIRIYRLTPWQAMRRVYLAAAAPLIFNGLKLAISYSVIGVIAAEFVLAPDDGLGHLVSFYYNNFALADMYAAVIIIIVFATIATAAVGRVEGAVRGRR